MTLMERIVRPHLPIDTGPGTQAPRCQQELRPTELRFKAPAGLGTGGTTFNLKQPTVSSAGRGGFKTEETQDPKKQEKTKNSSWSYAYKKYMTKVEKEQDKCADDDAGENRVTGGQATDKAVEDAAASGGSGPGTGPG